MNFAEYRAELSYAEGFNACLTKFASLLKESGVVGKMLENTSRKVPLGGKQMANIFSHSPNQSFATAHARVGAKMAGGATTGIRKTVADSVNVTDPSARAAFRMHDIKARFGSTNNAVNQGFKYGPSVAAAGTTGARALTPIRAAV